MSQSFYQANLCGKSFKGQNLSGVNFSYANIQGADFTDATLVGADFTNSLAGLQKRWSFGLIFASLILVFVAGLDTGYSGAAIGIIFVKQSNNGINLLLSISTTLILIIFGFVSAQRGLGAEIGILSVILAATVPLITAISPYEFTADTVIQSITIAGSISGIVTGSLATSVIQAISGRKFSTLSIILTLIGAFIGTSLGIPGSNFNEQASGIIFAVLMSAILIGLNIYFANKANLGDPRFSLIRVLTITLCAIKSTSFRNANLVNANFTQAKLKHTDFRAAVLKNTNWHGSKFMEYARTKGTYLANPIILELILTKDGKSKNFDRYDLRGLNLQGADLTDVSFVGANLSEANLQEADLSRVKLVQAQLYRTDLRQCCLTGAFIQDWAISTDTALDEVKCDYVYMRLPTTEDPDPWRKPDNRQENFKEGDFSDFIAPIVKTLDLYRTQSIDLRKMAGTFKTLDLFHHKGIDPAAVAVAIQQLSEEYPEAGFEIIALEGRGNEKIRLQAVVSSGTNGSDLSSEYFARYREVKSLSYENLQSLLSGMAEKDDRIRGLEKLLDNALHQPRFYVETYQNQGEFIMSQSKGNVNISNVQGNVSGVAAAGENQTMTGVAIGAISGTVTNTISHLPDTLDPTEPGIKELLLQLQALIEAETELPNEDKVEALEQVKILAEVGGKPEDSNLQKAGKTAIKILKGTFSGLSETTKLVSECAKLLPAISALLILF
jgi:uncharacterized protein YjbI with pentapeptide repeats